MQEPGSRGSILRLWSWLAGDVHPGRPVTWQLQQHIFSVHLLKVDLEEGPRLGEGEERCRVWGENQLVLASNPLAFPIGLCSPLSKAKAKAKALLFSQPPPSCHQNSLDCEEGSPLPRDLSKEFSYSHLLTCPPAASPPFLQL